MSSSRYVYPEVSASYKALNVGAHRKPAPVCGAPSLTWHRAFWQSCPDRKKWYWNIDAFLLCLYNECAKAHHNPRGDIHFTCPNKDESTGYVYFFRHKAASSADANGARSPLIEIESNERFLRYEVFSLRLKFYDVFLTIRAELFRELWTLTCILEFDTLFPNSIADARVPSEKPTPEIEESPSTTVLTTSDGQTRINSIYAMINDIQSLVTKRFADHKSKSFPTDLSEAEKTKIGRVRTVLIGEFRDSCNNLILGPANTSAETFCGEDYHSPLRNKVAEFFGNVIGIQLHNGEMRPISTFASEDGETKKRLTMPSLIGDSLYEKTVALQLIDAAWPFIRSHHDVAGLDANKRLGRRQEFSASLFQDKRALYISSLGRLNPNAHYTEGESEPVVYTIFVCNRSKWQIGRLIERMHNLGVCRIIALWELDKITSAGNQLHDLRRAVDSAGMLPSEAATEITKIQQSVPDGGLSYRVERSRYYVKQIKVLMSTLRTERIEGFQPYDRFIERRLSGTFDFIDRVGMLYSDLRSEITLQLDRARTQQFMRLASDIKINTTAIQAFTEQTSARQKTTNLLLDNAEILIALPVFYYFGQIISYVFYDMSNIDSLDFLGKSKILPFILSAIMTFFLVRYFRHRHEDAVRARKEK